MRNAGYFFAGVDWDCVLCLAYDEPGDRPFAISRVDPVLVVEEIVVVL